METTASTVGQRLGEVPWCSSDEQVEAEVDVGLPGPDGVATEGLAMEHLDLRDDRSTFLGKARLVEREDLEAVEERRGGQHLADRDHTGATHAGHVDRVDVVDRRAFRFGDVAVGAARRVPPIEMRTGWGTDATAGAGRVFFTRLVRFSLTLTNAGQSPSRHV